VWSLKSFRRGFGLTIGILLRHQGKKNRMRLGFVKYLGPLILFYPVRTLLFILLQLSRLVYLICLAAAISFHVLPQLGCLVYLIYLICHGHRTGLAPLFSHNLIFCHNGLLLVCKRLTCNVVVCEETSGPPTILLTCPLSRVSHQSA